MKVEVPVDANSPYYYAPNAPYALSSPIATPPAAASVTPHGPDPSLAAVAPSPEIPPSASPGENSTAIPGLNAELEPAPMPTPAPPVSRLSPIPDSSVAVQAVPNDESEAPSSVLGAAATYAPQPTTSPFVPSTVSPASFAAPTSKTQTITIYGYGADWTYFCEIVVLDFTLLIGLVAGCAVVMVDQRRRLSLRKQVATDRPSAELPSAPVASV